MCGRFTALTYEEIEEAIEGFGFGLGAWPSDSSQSEFFNKDIPDLDEGRNADWEDAHEDVYPGRQVNIIVPRSCLESADNSENLPRTPKRSPDSQSVEPVQFPGPAQPSELVQHSVVPATLTWGYKQDWQQKLIYNTRIESALSGKGMWKWSIEHGRCIVPAWRFYELHESEKVLAGPRHRVYRRYYSFEFPNFEPMFMAGVCQNGRFSVVTTEPNDCVRGVHNRMPIVLQPHEVMQWLGPDYAELADRSGIELAAQGLGELYVAPSEDSEKASDDGGQLSLF